MAEIFSFYSVAPSQGKRTLSLAFAELLAAEGYKTLYVELDLLHPSIAHTTQISNSIRNAVTFFENTITKKEFNLENYVINKEILSLNEDRELKRIFSTLPNKLDFLSLPSNFNINSFPVIVDSNEINAEQKANEYIEKLMYFLRTSHYEYVILNLPNELESIFGYEVISASDKVLNVVTPSANRLFENNEALKFLNTNIPDFESKLQIIVNQVSTYIDVQTVKDLIGSDTALVIPFDPERQQYEMSLEKGSPVINESVERLALMYQIQIEPKTSKKSFGLFKRS